ncbi:MAG: hypothetical protein LUH15_08285 [Tannerellaceae bacterium]|nr:hypothetical protein [Tannerellaceae bacterium]
MEQLKGGGYTDLCNTIYANLLCTAGCGNTPGSCNCGGGGNNNGGTNNGGSGYAVCCGYGGGYNGGGWTPITVTGYCW